MKVNSQLILKEGAVLTTEPIDFNDPEVKRFVAQSIRLQKQILKKRPYKNFVITL